MKQFAHSIRFALAVLALVGLAGPGIAQAQQPGRDLVKFQTEVSGTAVAAGIIPMDPPLVVGTMALKGTSELLGGAVTLTDSHVAHLGVDGTFLRSTDGIGVFTGPNGDALFVNWSGAARPTETEGLYAFTGAFTIRGGAGRFAGVVGSGIFNSRVNFKTFEVTQVWEGLVAMPKR